MRIDRQWINVRLRDGFFTDEFEARIEEFVDFAQRHPELMDGTKIRCLCNDRKCHNRSFQEPDIVQFHLAKNGFVRDYYVWYKHGETIVQQTSNQNVQRSVESDVAIEYAQPNNACQAMLMDVIGPSSILMSLRISQTQQYKNFMKCLKHHNKRFGLVIRIATQTYLWRPDC